MSLRVLLACEFSGVVRDAFRARGVDAISCDLLPSERPGPHVAGDVLQLLRVEQFDMMLAFPPCTFLSGAGRYLWPDRRDEQAAALAFVLALATAPVERIAIENPRGALTKLWRRPDQVVSPHMFGHDYTKATCWWLKGLPPLLATCVHSDPMPFLAKFPHSGAGHLPQGPSWRRRVRFPDGLAEAMSSQWSSQITAVSGSLTASPRP